MYLPRLQSLPRVKGRGQRQLNRLVVHNRMDEGQTEAGAYAHLPRLRSFPRAMGAAPVEAEGRLVAHSLLTDTAGAEAAGHL